MTSERTALRNWVIAMVVCCQPLFAEELGTAFNYQGQLKSGEALVGDACDFEFTLWDAAVDGVQVGPTLTFDGMDPNPAPIDVTDGHFTASLDFGEGAFDGQKRWLAISVVCPSGGALEALTPRQEISSAPNALKTRGIDGHSLDSADGSVEDALFVDNTGNVGIGTVTPAAALDVAGDIATETGIVGTPGNTLDLKVNNARGMRIEYAEVDGNPAPNVIAGHVSNSVSAGAGGAVIAGGGGDGQPNQVAADLGTVSGGKGNLSFGNRSTVSGGEGNTAAGGWSAASGGQGNTALGDWSAVSGGLSNEANGSHSVVGGGTTNVASGNQSTVAGGESNDASGAHSTVAGGKLNVAAGDFSLAGGRRAKANHAGSFVWADSTAADFASESSDQFRVRAAGGMSLYDGDFTLQVPDNLEDQSILFRNSGGAYTWRIYRKDAGSNDADLRIAGGISNSDPLALADRLTIDKNGHVGIGTTTPGFPLSFPNTLGDKISLWGTSGDHYGLGVAQTLLQIHSDAAGSDIAFGHGRSDAFVENMRIEGTGNVGIGTDDPLNKLDVAGSVVVGAGYAGSALTPNANGLLVEGNVGIGTTLPGAKLHVLGDGGLALESSTGSIMHILPEINVSAFNPGNSTVAAQITNRRFGHLVFDIEANDGGDSFAIRTDSNADGQIDTIAMVVKPSGRVGIGTTSPLQKLHVNGHVRADGLYSSTGSIHGNDAARLKSGGNGQSVSFKTEFAPGFITIWNDATGIFKTFVIDHPLHSAKHLVHVTLEGPEVAVFYRGSGQLKDGHVRIELPAYFEALTMQTGRTIQLTNVDGFDRLAVRSQRGRQIVDGVFEVHSDNPRSIQTFNWEVMAKRYDSDALVVEPNRTGVEIRGDGPYTYAVPRRGARHALAGDAR